MYAYVPSGLPQTLANAGELMRLRFRVPTTRDSLHQWLRALR